MNIKRNKVGQVLGIGIGAMLLAGLMSCALTSLMIEKGVITEAMGALICWLLTGIGAYGVSWYTAKRSKKNKMQMAAAVIGIYLLGCTVMGSVLFPNRDMKLSIWIAVLAGAAALGTVTSCVKKERKR